MPLSIKGAVYPLLTDLASGQGGYFLAIQSSQLGVSRLQLSRFRERGMLERDSRGLYRLSGYPLGEDSELWAAILWAGTKGGKPHAILCYETALSMFGVSTVDPARIDLAIPKGARLRRRGNQRYRLQYYTYLPEEITRVRGLPTTTLARTVLDLLLEQRSLQFVDEALKRAPARGLLTSKELSTLQLLRSGDPALVSAIRRS